MGRVRVVPATGTVFAGTGTVWENPTRGLPVLNPSGSQMCVICETEHGGEWLSVVAVL